MNPNQAPCQAGDVDREYHPGAKFKSTDGVATTGRFRLPAHVNHFIPSHHEDGTTGEDV
ncbi:hypothetical protein IQ268_13735 [Oculatella sp. LEGE 06141]|uniref:hypothetical protein n=1 Tax=Oculatella sp. LEGE 06141 TaxID=1828648 RepID=UPI0018823226|nr:hypothetical protein [Oculatella sp. LEGE 06141]MBE9179624.1 hypothetical protein [Oculatella sp. LEGE 06141]